MIARVEIERLRGQGRSLGRLQLGGPEIGLRRIHDEDAQVVLGGLNLALGDDHLFFGSCDFGLSLHDVDRRDRAELHFLLVVPQRSLRQLIRLLRNLQRADRVDQVEIGVADDSRGLGQALPKLHVGDFQILLALKQVLPLRINLEVAKQRLRVDRRKARIELRVERVGRIVRRHPRGIEAERVAPAAPGHELVDASACPEAVIRQDAALGASREKIGWRCSGTPGRRCRRQVEGVCRTRLRNTVGPDLRAQPVGLDTEVVLERHPDGFIRRDFECGRRRRGVERPRWLSRLRRRLGLFGSGQCRTESEHR